VIKFGLNKNAQFYASKIEYLGPDGIIFYVNGFYPFHLPIYSSAAIYNALTAISIARILGVEFSEIKEALETRFRLLEGTGNLIKHKKNYVLDYTYDATINSVHKACESLVQFNPYSKKLILVIGDIRNPGPKAKEAHLKIGYYIAALPIHTVLTIGENAEYIGEGIRQINQTKKQIDSFKDSEELIKKLPEYLDYQSTLLFTGSKKLKLKKTLNQALPLLK
jgi:UDP-N-acetylmuramoyl-tripeptide--D-alanyl-D-alanine ligase